MRRVLFLSLAMVLGLLFGAPASAQVAKMLPVCNAGEWNLCGVQPTVGAQALVIDGADATDCETGGGTLGSADATHLCIFGPGGWFAAGTGAGGGGSSAFSAITGGTNTTAAMVVGTGAVLVPSGSGQITATSANAGDSATSFFSTGQIERARGGLGADTSIYGAGIIGSDVSNATVDVDTEAELETAIGGVDVYTSTDESDIEALLEVDSLQGDFTADKLDLAAGAADRVCKFDANGDPDCSATVHNDHGLLGGLTDDDHTIYTQRTNGTTDPRSGSVNCDTIGDIYTFTTPTPDLVFVCVATGATGTWRVMGEFSIVADEQQTSITTAGQCVTIGYADSNNFATASCTSGGQLYYATEAMMVTGFTVRQIDPVIDNTGCTITLQKNGSLVTGATIHTGDTGGTADINAPGETLTINLTEPLAAGDFINIKTDDDTGTHCDNAGAVACDCDAWDLQWRVGVRGIMQ